MIINSNEFIRFVERHLLMNNSHNEWNAQIEKMNNISLLDTNTYQALKVIINNT